MVEWWEKMYEYVRGPFLSFCTVSPFSNFSLTTFLKKTPYSSYSIITLRDEYDPIRNGENITMEMYGHEYDHVFRIGHARCI